MPAAVGEFLAALAWAAERLLRVMLDMHGRAACMARHVTARAIAFDAFGPDGFC
jgi:hypothetical protein